MGNTNLTIQKEWNYCLCSVIQSIFKDYGINVNQDYIASKLTPAKNGFLVEDENVKRLFTSNGFSYNFYFHNEVPFNEPDFLLEEIKENSGFLGINHHVYKIVDFVDPTIKILNPKDSKVRNSDLYQMTRLLKRLGGGFGLVKKFSNYQTLNF